MATTKKSAPGKPSPKKTVAKSGGAARVVPKQSPLKGMSVDAWVKAKTSGWQAALVGDLIAAVKAAAPESTVSIKWAQPVFEANGPFAYVRVAKAHVTFGFWRGAELKDPNKVLEGTGDRMSHLKFTGPAKIDASISAMIREAVKLNRDKGDPTKRG